MPVEASESINDRGKKQGVSLMGKPRVAPVRLSSRPIRSRYCFSVHAALNDCLSAAIMLCSSGPQDLRTLGPRLFDQKLAVLHDLASINKNVEARRNHVDVRR